MRQQTCCAWVVMLFGVASCVSGDVLRQPLVTAAPEASAWAELRERAAAPIDPASFVEVLLTALPQSLLQLGATNLPAASKLIWSEFLDTTTPEWFQALPTDIQSYLSGLYAPKTTEPSLTTRSSASGPTSTAASARATVTDSTQTPSNTVTNAGATDSASGSLQSHLAASTTPNLSSAAAASKSRASDLTASLITSPSSAISERPLSTLPSSTTVKSATETTLLTKTSTGTIETTQTTILTVSVSLTQAAVSTTTASNTSNASRSSPTTTRDLALGLGIPLGLIAVVGIGGCLYLLQRRHRKRREMELLSSDDDDGDESHPALLPRGGAGPRGSGSTGMTERNTDPYWSPARGGMLQQQRLPRLPDIDPYDYPFPDVAQNSESIRARNGQKPDASTQIVTETPLGSHPSSPISPLSLSPSPTSSSSPRTLPTVTAAAAATGANEVVAATTAGVAAAGLARSTSKGRSNGKTPGTGNGHGRKNKRKRTSSTSLGSIPEERASMLETAPAAGEPDLSPSETTPPAPSTTASQPRLDNTTAYSRSGGTAATTTPQQYIQDESDRDGDLSPSTLIPPPRSRNPEMVHRRGSNSEWLVLGTSPPQLPSPQRHRRSSSGSSEAWSPTSGAASHQAEMRWEDVPLWSSAVGGRHPQSSQQQGRRGSGSSSMASPTASAFAPAGTLYSPNPSSPPPRRNVHPAGSERAPQPRSPAPEGGIMDLDLSPLELGFGSTGDDAYAAALRAGGLRDSSSSTAMRRGSWRGGAAGAGFAQEGVRPDGWYRGPPPGLRMEVGRGKGRTGGWEG